MRKGRLGLGLLGVGLLLPATGQAAAIEFDNYCTLGAFKVCASVHVFTSPDSRNITLRLWNLERNDSPTDPYGQASTFTAIGLYHANPAYAYDGDVEFDYAVFDGDWILPTLGWLGHGNGGLGHGMEVSRSTTLGNAAGIVGCTDPGSLHYSTCGTFPGGPYLELNFHTEKAFSLESLQFRLHAQQVGPYGRYSVKCDSGVTSGEHACVPTNVVPEPITTVLLGSGLLGVAGAGLRRRRKGLDVTSA